MPRIVFGQQDRDLYTLRQVAEQGLTLVFECRNCRKVSQADVLELEARYGTHATPGELRVKATCLRCRKRVADILMRDPGMRGNKGWWPRPPGGRG